MNKLLKTQIPALAVIFTFVIPLFAPLFVSKANSQTTSSTLILEASADIFVSPSTTNGNRRMLFVGTYTDETVCTPEGCPPVYVDSVSYMNFNLASLAADTIITTAKLQLYHYGSNAEFNLKVAKTSESWDESTNTNYPTFSDKIGEANISSFNTADSSQIRLEEINLDLSNYGSLINVGNYQRFANGFALISNGGIGDPGIVFCSSNSDSFCLPQYRPKLVVTTQSNNPPQRPNLISPNDDQNFSGICDQSNNSGECFTPQRVILTANNIGDSDPGNGTYNFSTFRLTNLINSETFDTPNLYENSEVNYDMLVPDGKYSVKAISFDKRNLSSESDSRIFVVDTTPPELVKISPLASITRPTFNQIRVNVSGNITTDNISNSDGILYQLQYSSDSSFLSKTSLTDWAISPNFLLTEVVLNPDQTYFFRIKAKDALGNISEWSDTAATSLEGLPLQPLLNKSGWGGSNNLPETQGGIYAKGVYPEKARINQNYVMRSDNMSFVGVAEQNKFVQVFVNNKLISEAQVSNDNCVAKGNRTVCNFYFNYKFIDNGANNSQGVPLNSYSFQFRAIDDLGNASILSAKEIIAHDKVPPKIAEISNQLPEVTNSTNANINVSAERYSDVEYKIFRQKNGIKELTNKAIKRADAKGDSSNSFILGSEELDSIDSSCISLVLEKSKNKCFDGIYFLEVTIYDASGNKSVTKSVTIKRDTIAPNLSNFEVINCGNNICANVEGEPKSEIFVNQKSYGYLGENGKATNLVIANSWRYNQTYQFKATLKDNATNISNERSAKFLTPLITAGGKGGYPDAKIDQKEVFTQEISNQIVINIDYSLSKKEYKISNVDIPSPKLLDYYSDYSGVITIYGIAVPKDKKLRIKLKTQYLSYTDAYKVCYIDRWNVIEWKNDCINKQMGYTNGVINNLNCLVHSCILNGKTERTEFEIDNSNSENIFYQNTSSDGFLTNESNSGRISVETLLNKPLKDGDAVLLRTHIKGEIELEGRSVSYDNYSDKSNELTIRKSSFSNINGKIAKVLDVPYFNQYIEPNGTKGIPADGWKMCGAASSVMVAGYFNKLPISGNSTNLKDYMYQDQGQGIKKESTNVTCHDGAFGITGGGYLSYYDPQLKRNINVLVNCDQSTAEGIQRYLSFIGLKPGKYTAGLTFDLVKQYIDSNQPIILSYGWKGTSLGHIIVVKGYTVDGKIVVNDSYKDVFKHPEDKESGRYYSDGENAIYDLNYFKFNQGYYLPIGEI